MSHANKNWRLRTCGIQQNPRDPTSGTKRHVILPGCRHVFSRPLLSLGFAAGNAFGQDRQEPPPPPAAQAAISNRDQAWDRHMGRRPMQSVDDQLKHLTKKLNLSDDQQTKLKPILEDQRKQMEADPQRFVAVTRGQVQQDAGVSAKLRHGDQERAERRPAEELRQDARRAARPDEAMA